MDEYEKRKVAITRYYSGEKISSIVSSLGRTRSGFIIGLNGSSCALMIIVGTLMNHGLPRENHKKSAMMRRGRYWILEVGLMRSIMHKPGQLQFNMNFAIGS